MKKYVINWGPELGWAVLVAVVLEAGQILARSDLTAVLQDPEAWGVSAAGAVARVAWAVIKNFIVSKVGKAA